VKHTFLRFRFTIDSVLFIPYANTNHDAYLETVKGAFSKLNLGCSVRSIHEGENPIEEVRRAKAIFIGGGNTFLLLKTLYDHGLVDVIRARVLEVSGILSSREPSQTVSLLKNRPRMFVSGGYMSMISIAQ